MQDRFQADKGAGHIHNKLWWLPALWLWLASPAPVTAQEVTLAMENAEITDLINWASDYLGKTIIIHPGVQGRVSILSGEPVTPDEAYQVFLSALQVHGFAVVEDDNVLKVLPQNVAKQSGTPLITEPAEAGREDLGVQIIRLNHADAAQMVTLLQPFTSEVGHITSYPQSNSLIIADRAGNMAEMADIIAEFDRSGLFEVEMLALEFADTADVMKVITTLVQGKGENQQLTFVADERTNSILVTGNVVARQQVRELVKRLDKPLPSKGNTRVIRVNYLDAKELATILQGLHAGLRQSEQAQPFEQEVNIQVSEAVNALIITAPPKLMETMRGIIRELDVRRQQVLVEAVIVEVTTDLMSDLGIEWRTSVPGDDGIFTGVNALPAAVPGGVPSADVALGPGFTLGFLRSSSLRALVRALQSDTNANILSTPTVVTLDNEEAKILVGSNIPFITGSSTSAASSTTNPFQTIQRQDIGITLNVKPRINEKKSIILEIEQTVESITSSTVATADIITNKRNIETSVRLDNDQVLVLGGLVSDEIQQGEKKVPLLGDIPILGRLFKSTSISTKKTNLLVFIHPVILEDPDKVDRLTLERYNTIRSLQQSFNKRAAGPLFLRDLPVLPELESSDAGATVLPTPAGSGSEEPVLPAPVGASGEELLLPTLRGSDAEAPVLPDPSGSDNEENGAPE